MAIKDIISKNRVATQEELCEALLERGHAVTQATVSRDIREMKLIKVPSTEGYYYALPDTPGLKPSLERMKRVFNDSVVALVASENLVVVKTLPGTANSVASVIDGAEIPEIAGTVAGDDTILVVIAPKEAAQRIMERFNELIQ
jgi:transcriptional regulator of arginine metabolism